MSKNWLLESGRVSIEMGIWLKYNAAGGMKMETIATDKAPAAIGHYSQAVKVKCSELVFLSGQIAIDPATGQVATGSIEQETEQVFKNIGAILTAAGLSASNVVKTTVFLADMKDFEAVNRIYAKFFGEHKPARSTAQVAGLPRGVSIEIELVACK